MTIGLTTYDQFAKDVSGASTFLRIDAIGGQRASDTYRIRENAAKFQAMYERARASGGVTNARLDALGTNVGLHLARQLEQIYSEVLVDQTAPHNGLDLFEVDRSVSPGARTHTLRRLKHNGEARFYDGAASRRPAASIEQREEQFGTAPIVTSIHIDFFDQLSADFAGTSLRAELENAARDVMDQFISDIIFSGAPERNLAGVFTHPWIAKQVSGITLGVSSPDAVLADLHTKAHYARARSKGRHAPTRLITSLRGENYLNTTKRSATTSETIGQAFLKDNPYITEIIGIHEAEGAGPDGTDIMLFDRKSKDAFARVMPQEFTMLPAIDSGFSIEIPCYAIYGGMVSREPLHNMISYVATSGI